MPIHVVIDCPGSLAEPNPEIKVKADGVESQDQLGTLLLTVIERITGISTSGYVDLVNQARIVAAREQSRTVSPSSTAEEANR